MFKHSTTQIGELTCHLIDQLPTGQAPKQVVILCHGFGAPGHDLVPLGPELLQLQPNLQETTRFIFPEAPLSLDAIGYIGGRAWWMLDVAALNEAIATGQFRDQTKQLPDDLPKVSEMITTVVNHAMAEDNLAMGQIVLGGFSQGAMVTTDVALQLPEAPAALCVMSGTLLCEDNWRRLAEQRESLTVLQSHGRQDPILPFGAAEWLRDMLRECGADVEFIEFNGVHSIPPQLLNRFGELLSELATG
jgi:phospholipase/carboxylesterase